MADWISAEERMPEFGVAVIAFERFSRKDDCDVTHWMPLPEPPNV